jgi:CMP/dCMP kinase
MVDDQQSVGDLVARNERLQVIAIDGPAASGKSTVGYDVAERLGYLFFDTGILYRAVTWAMLAQGVDVYSSDSAGIVAEEAVIDIAPGNPENGELVNRILVDGVDVTEAIRSKPVEQHVSAVSAHSSVRHALTAQQRRIGHRYGSGEAEKAGVVMVGRDIGTVVMPDAGLKIYMDATVEVRAERRFLELKRKGLNVTPEEVLEDIQRRDQFDSQRSLSPLRIADDAIVIDTSRMTPEAVVERILELVDVYLQNASAGVE